jgi:hypothetical protein
MEDINTALADLQAAVLAYLAENPGKLTFDVGSYRIVVTQGEEIVSVTHR